MTIKCKTKKIECKYRHVANKQVGKGSG